MLSLLADSYLPIRSPDSGEIVYDIAGYLETLLSAFDQDPQSIYAGGPFSDWHGSAQNNFKEFLPLSRYQRLACKLRLGGPAALKDEPGIFLSDEFKKSYLGLHQIIMEGLARAELIGVSQKRPVSMIFFGKPEPTLSPFSPGWLPKPHLAHPNTEVILPLGRKSITRATLNPTAMLASKLAMRIQEMIPTQCIPSQKFSCGSAPSFKMGGNSNCNPTLTIMALATRIGAQMLFPGNPSQAIGTPPVT